MERMRIINARDGDYQRAHGSDVTDTSAEVMERYRSMLLARSASERVLMAAQMFDAARAMVLASFPPDLSPDEQRRRLFARMYGDDVPPHRVPEPLRPRTESV
jgi:hypothetical protein